MQQKEKLKKIRALLGPVDVFAAKKSSPNFKKIARTQPIQPVRVKAESLEEALNVLRDNYSVLLEMVEKRRNGDRNEKIPILDKP